MFWLVVWVTSRAFILQVSLLAPYAKHTNPVLKPTGTLIIISRQKIFCVNVASCSTPSSFKSFVTLTPDLSPCFISVVKLLFINGVLESLNKCRLGWEWIHTPRLHSHIHMCDLWMAAPRWAAFVLSERVYFCNTVNVYPTLINVTFINGSQDNNYC